MNVARVIKVMASGDSQNRPYDNWILQLAVAFMRRKKGNAPQGAGRWGMEKICFK